MEQGTQTLTLKDTTANPAPLGLLGFGMTTILLNLHNAGAYELNAMILAMGVFYGGLAQILTGIIEWKKNNLFGMVAFTSYGFFWQSLVLLLILPKMGWVATTSNDALVAYLCMWGFFTLCMFFGTLNKDRMLQFVFGSLTVLFFLLALADWQQSPTLKVIAGIEGILCGASAFYLAIAMVLNDAYGRRILRA